LASKFNFRAGWRVLWNGIFCLIKEVPHRIWE
jgi:hypothetical protein